MSTLMATTSNDLVTTGTPSDARTVGHGAPGVGAAVAFPTAPAATMATGTPTIAITAPSTTRRDRPRGGRQRSTLGAAHGDRRRRAATATAAAGRLTASASAASRATWTRNGRWGGAGPPHSQAWSGGAA